MFCIVGTWFISSIPIARSIQKRRWFVQNQRLSLYSGPTFGLTSDFEIQKEKSRSVETVEKEPPFAIIRSG